MGAVKTGIGIPVIIHPNLTACLLPVAQGDDILEEGSQNLAAVMESMGIYDTDLRERGGAQGSSNKNTQQLLKILLDTLNKAVAQGAAGEQPSLGTGRGEPELGLGKPQQPPRQDYLEVSLWTSSCKSCL